MKSETRNQHYVPQFLLKNFSSGKKDQVYVYDKLTSKTFKTRARNVAAERDFYNFKIQDIELSLEESLTNVESKASAIIKKILLERSIGSLSLDEFGLLAFFTAIQFQRTRKMRSRLKGWDKQIQDKILEMGGDVHKVKGYKPFTEESLKEMNIQMLMQQVPEYAEMIAIKSPILYEAPDGYGFYISDDPVALFNHNDFGPYGNLGLLVPGIQIYLPLSPKLALCFCCPTISESMDKSSKQIWELLKHSPEMLRQLKDPSYLLAFNQAFKDGKPLKLVAENMEHHNSLQALHSDRYVFSHDGDFELLDRMKKSNHI